MSDTVHTLGPTGELADRVAYLRRVLGKGPDERAIYRLVELWPDAIVHVSHQEGDCGSLAWPCHRRWTTVRITRDGGEGNVPVVIAKSVCHPDDTFEKSKGIERGFREAVKLVKKVVDAPTVEKLETALGEGRR